MMKVASRIQPTSFGFVILDPADELVGIPEPAYELRLRHPGSIPRASWHPGVGQHASWHSGAGPRARWHPGDAGRRHGTQWVEPATRL